MEFDLGQLPPHLIQKVFNKMDPKQFQEAFALNSFCKETFESTINCSFYTPIYYLDMTKRNQIVKKVLALKGEYINAILKNIQNNSFELQFMVISFEKNENIEIEAMLFGLETTIYWKRGDSNCVFAKAPADHIFPPNRAVFAVKNKKVFLELEK